MGLYKNFKTVVYCVAGWADKVGEERLEQEIKFFQKYVGVDKVYLETFRGKPASQQQIDLCKRIFQKHNIEVSGGITTVVPDLCDEDKKRQRLFGTFCYSNEKMREYLKEMCIYTAKNFDEFIIDDFYFTQCMCEDCQREKGDKSWEEYRLAKMAEVSENLIIKPAKEVNPNVKIIIKYPNWRESYQETGYNPEIQKDMFDKIYAGTETRHPSHTDQHLPRYLSYSIMRYMENTAPLRNGGGWFDPFECYPIDTYLEQAYLTAFSKPQEMMMFCWSALYNNKVVTPLGFMLESLDKILGDLGKPVGIPVYLPYNSQGEDHLEDYLGMAGIPFEPVPQFPENSKSIFLTSAALKDKDIIIKLKNYINNGGKAIVTNGFMTKSLEMKNGIEDLTSIRNNHRHISANEFCIAEIPQGNMNFVKSAEKIDFPVLEHRNNASWSLMNAGSGDHHASILLKDTYGKGLLLTLTLPDTYSSIKKLPEEALLKLRYEFLCDNYVYIDAPAQILLFAYDNDTFGLYSCTADHAKPAKVKIHVAKDVESLTVIGSDKEIQPLYKNKGETIFETKIDPGSYIFFRINNNHV